LSLCLTKHHFTKTYWGTCVKASRILNPGTRWRWMVNFTPRPLYSQGKSPRYPLDRRLGGPQDPVWRLWRREKIPFNPTYFCCIFNFFFNDWFSWQFPWLRAVCCCDNLTQTDNLICILNLLIIGYERRHWVIKLSCRQYSLVCFRFQLFVFEIFNRSIYKQ
jgi:hypothetical protein